MIYNGEDIDLSDTPVGRTALKRSSILAAASDLFLRHGFLGTSMDEVAARAAVSKQTVYKQFENKEALFVGIVQSMTRDATGRAQIPLRDPKDWEQVERYLHAQAHRWLDVVLDPQLLQLRRLVIGEVGRFPELGRALYEGGPGRSIATLAETFQRWGERGLLAFEDPAMAASHFNWLIMGDPLAWAMFHGDDVLPDEAMRKKHVAAGVRVFLAAYAPSQP